MKKSLFTVAAVMIALASQLHAQTKVDPMTVGNTGFYVGVHGGYNLGIAKDSERLNYTQEANGDWTREAVPFSYGQGANFGLDLGYMFSKNLGAELGIDYLMGAKTETTRTYNDGDVSKYDHYGKMLLLQPKVVVKANPKTVTPYAKFGLAVGLMPKVNEDYRETWNNGNSYYTEVFEMEEGMAFGVTGAVGFDYALNSNMAVYTELRSMAVSYSPKKGTYTEALYNGEDDLQYWDYDQIHYEYVDQLHANDNQGDNTPTKETKFTLPFSNFGLNVGFKYSF